MTDTIREAFQKWCVYNDLETYDAVEGWTAFQAGAAHERAELLPVIQRLREALIFYDMHPNSMAGSRGLEEIITTTEKYKEVL